MNDLPIEKQFTHAHFLRQIENIDLETAKKLLEELHMLYLAQQATITKIARNDFWRR